MATILVLNGPNMNLLGRREPGHYGAQSLPEINKRLTALAKDLGLKVQFFQSNAEHELVERVHKALDEAIRFIIINPAALTHTSVALRDALAATALPFIEVHLSNIHAREAFRRTSYFSDLAAGVISGLGAVGYELALRAVAHHIEKHKDS
ncbi:MAG: type II 3-dehydroquinate dehydratase [Gammaproteobacteria bacterium]|nr:type II 3-dehydroquinate dehydratase [Gammaproteobacteria bacterium]